MKRIDSVNKVPNLFGAGKDGFGPGNKALGQKATYLDPEWCNHIQEEIAQVIEGAGVALDAAKYDQLKTAITLLIGDAVGEGLLRRTVNTADLAAGFYITPLAIPVADGVATPDYLARNLHTLAIAGNLTLAAPAVIPAGGGARIIATVTAASAAALTLAAAYRIIDGEFDGSAGAVNIIDLVFGGPSGLIDVQISQRGAA